MSVINISLAKQRRATKKEETVSEQLISEREDKRNRTQFDWLNHTSKLEQRAIDEAGKKEILDSAKNVIQKHHKLLKKLKD